jgi:phospholipid transport system substrate-binding protein
VNRRRSFLVAVACSLVLGVASAAWAGAAEDLVKNKQTQLTTLVKQNKPDAEVDKVFDSLLDYKVLAEASLGTHWADRTDAEREEFTTLLSKLIRASYRRNLKKTLGYNIEYKGTEPGKDGEVVRTTATKAKASGSDPASIDIDYVVRSQRVIDVVTDGSSMVGNYRSSFNRIMKKGGFAEVLKRMRKKAADGSASAD